MVEIKITKVCFCPTLTKNKRESSFIGRIEYKIAENEQPIIRFQKKPRNYQRCIAKLVFPSGQSVKCEFRYRNGTNELGEKIFDFSVEDSVYYLTNLPFK